MSDRNRRPLSIAMVCYPTYGGSGIVATELGQALAERGHTVHFVCYNQPARLRGLGGTVHFHPVDVITYPLFKFPPYTLALASRLARIITEEGVDLIHVHYAIPHTLAAQTARDMTGRNDLPLVTTLHGTDVQLVGLDPSYRDITRWLMERCCTLTAVSRYLADTTEREFALTRRIETIHNFVDLARFRRREDRRLRRRLAPGGEKIVIHVSNFREVKHTTDVVRAFNRIRKAVPSVLVMIGEGPDRPATEALAKRLGIDDLVRFVDFVPGVERWLGTSDLLLLPSSMESFGLAVLEAMACQTPALAYRVGGLPEVVGDGEGGILVDPGDWRAMADEGIAILSDPARWTELGNLGRARAARCFDRERMVGVYEALYRRILGPPG
jgi:N-acetyl-alpha-D-glucosaminyl L-malate synthase BshA